MRLLSLRVPGLLLLSGCHPPIFEYSFELFDVVIVDGQASTGNFTTPPATTYDLSFFSDQFQPLSCSSSTEELLKQVESIHSVSWQVGGFFSSGGTGAMPIRHRVPEGASISGDMRYRIVLGTCTDGVELGSGVIPGGTRVLAMPEQLENPYVSGSVYRPEGDNELFDWTPFDNTDVFLDSLQLTNADRYTSVETLNPALDATLCIDPLYFEPTGTDTNQYGSAVIVNVVRFSLEGSGHPCMDDTGGGP